jgi:hypothetical protein
MVVLDILVGVAETGRWGPVVTGGDWAEVTAAFGEPWDAGTMGGSRRWPRLFAYGDLELSVCGCRRIVLVCFQAWREVIELPLPGAGKTRAYPGGLTYGDVTRALDRAGCPWRADASLTFGDQRAITALPSGATFVFEAVDGAEPVLDVMGLPGDFHDCPAPAPRAVPEG